MANSLYTHAASKSAILVTFTWGDASVARYNSTSEDVTIGSDVYTSAPEIEVTTGRLQGSPKDEPWLVRMRTDRPPFLTLCRPYAHAPIRCTIAEVDPSDDTTLTVRWVGTVIGTLKNQPNKPGLVNATVAGWRALLQYPLGIECTTQCAWTFGDQNCCVDLTAIRQTGTVTAITGNLVTITGLTYVRANYFRYGSVLFDGLAMRIIDYDGGAGTFHLVTKLPPPEWMGQTVTVTPGCDRLIDGTNGCRSRNNEQRFCGLGVKMIDYNPQFESK
jgi:hypothetical protein